MRFFASILSLTLILPPVGVLAQSRHMAVDGKTSLAWWQIDPHYEHLWSTTCPADPSWQPGEGRDPGQYTDYTTRPKTIAAGRSDSRVPLFPRYRVRPICRQAVSGEVTMQDTERLRGVRGKITIIADSLYTGLTMRDIYERRAVFETARYPEITFVLDSLADVQRGDTIRATAFGKITIHGVTEAIRAPVMVTRDPAGLRVRTLISMPATALTETFLMSKVALSMGVVMKRWKTIHMGVDFILKPAES